jgi:CheY-like chemotaxis protein
VVLHRAVVSAGHEVEEAANGADARAAYTRRRRDVVLIDILMPEKEGLETIRELRALDPAAKIIAMSGGGATGAGGGANFLSLAVLFGAAHVLSKPFSAGELLESVAAVLAVPGSRQE